jgi:hypothetical protein
VAPLDAELAVPVGAYAAESLYDEGLCGERSELTPLLVEQLRDLQPFL